MHIPTLLMAVQWPSRMQAVPLCKAALQAASLNVFVNTKLMTNREFATALEHTAEQLLDAGTSYADEAFHYVNEKLRSK